MLVSRGRAHHISLMGDGVECRVQRQESTSHQWVCGAASIWVRISAITAAPSIFALKTVWTQGVQLQQPALLRVAAAAHPGCSSARPRGMGGPVVVAEAAVVVAEAAVVVAEAAVVVAEPAEAVVVGEVAAVAVHAVRALVWRTMRTQRTAGHQSPGCSRQWSSGVGGISGWDRHHACEAARRSVDHC